MPKHIKTLDDLEQEFNNAKTKAVIIDFYATWCGPCKMISPKLEEWEKKYSNIIVLKVDVDESELIAEKYEISAMPTFLVFKEAKLVEKIIGANADKIENAFKKFSEIENEKMIHLKPFNISANKKVAISEEEPSRAKPINVKKTIAKIPMVSQSQSVLKEPQKIETILSGRISQAANIDEPKISSQISIKFVDLPVREPERQVDKATSTSNMGASGFSKTRNIAHTHKIRENMNEQGCSKSKDGLLSSPRFTKVSSSSKSTLSQKSKHQSSNQKNTAKISLAEPKQRDGSRGRSPNRKSTPKPRRGTSPSGRSQLSQASSLHEGKVLMHVINKTHGGKH